MDNKIKDYCFRDIRSRDIENECLNIDCLVKRGKLYVLDSGTVLYTGSRVEDPHTKYNASHKITKTKEEIFNYTGMRSKTNTISNYVSYFSTNVETGKGYAINPAFGWVTKFYTTKPIYVYKLDTFLDFEEVDECFCKFPKTTHDIELNGIYVDYGFMNGVDQNEFAICNSWEYMDYMGTAIMEKNRELLPFKILYSVVNE